MQDAGPVADADWDLPQCRRLNLLIGAVSVALEVHYQPVHMVWDFRLYLFQSMCADLGQILRWLIYRNFTIVMSLWHFI